MSTNLTTVMLIPGAVLIVAIAGGVGWALWRRSAPDRARAAALVMLTSLAQRLGVAVAAGDHGMPMLSLAGPRGRLLTVRAELVPRGAPMNDEPDAWMRKLLVGLAWVLLSVLMCALFALLAAGSSSSSSSSFSSSSSSPGPVRRMTLATPLAPYFGPLVLRSKHGVWNRLRASLCGSWIEIGDPAFDGAFWVGGPREHARYALTPPVRAALLGFAAAHGRFAVERATLVWSRRTYATEGLEHVLDAMGRLTTALG